MVIRRRKSKIPKRTIRRRKSKIPKRAIRRRKSKIPKGQSEDVNRRITDNTMAKRKRTNNDLQNITSKAKDRATSTPLKPGGDFVSD